MLKPPICPLHRRRMRLRIERCPSFVATFHEHRGTREVFRCPVATCYRIEEYNRSFHGTYTMRKGNYLCNTNPFNPATSTERRTK